MVPSWSTQEPSNCINLRKDLSRFNASTAYHQTDPNEQTPRQVSNCETGLLATLEEALTKLSEFINDRANQSNAQSLRKIYQELNGCKDKREDEMHRELKTTLKKMNGLKRSADVSVRLFLDPIVETLWAQLKTESRRN
jgi:hypothetical protein